MLTADDFDRWYRAHNVRMFHHALHMLGSHVPTAEDVVAQAWLNAWEQRGRFQDRGTGPLPWLITLVKYAALAEIRDRRTLVNLGDDEEEDGLKPFVTDPTPYPGLESPETHRAWAQVTPILSELQAVGVWCWCVGGYSLDETAGILGTPDNRVAAATVNDGLRKISRYFHGDHRAPQDCKLCGWPRQSIGHRTICGRHRTGLKPEALEAHRARQRELAAARSEEYNAKRRARRAATRS